MPFTYEQVFAVDPANTDNVAGGASVLIFAPGDTTKTPLTITTPDGAPLANPIPTNANGFGSAFAHATLDRVAWEGGGFTGFFTSYEGMKQVAVDAQAAAEDAAVQAEVSATAPTDAAVAASVDKKLPPAINDALANDPSVASAAATLAQSNAGLVPLWKASTTYSAGQRVVAPNGDVVSAKAAFTSGATYNPTNWNASTQDARLKTIETVGDLTNLVTNGTFRDGMNGWGNLGAWVAQNNTITSWARTMSGGDGALSQSITVPARLLGSQLRLTVLAMTTSTGTLRTSIVTASGTTTLDQALTTAYVAKTLDVTVPANQGSTPITLNVGRFTGTVYMTAIRLEAL